MDETYTPPTPPQEETSFDKHFNDVLELQDSAAAARRRFAVDEPEAVSEEPAGESVPPQNQPRAERNRGWSKKDTLITAGLVGVAALGVAGTIGMEGGSAHGDERGNIDDTINSITLSPDAHLRSDPLVGDPRDNTYNDVLELGVKVTIDANHDIRVLNGTDKGAWYGIPIADIEAVAPSAASVKDNDGMLWVNQLGVESIDTGEQQAAQ